MSTWHDVKKEEGDEGKESGELQRMLQLLFD
jgi:hypothetical protein